MPIFFSWGPLWLRLTMAMLTLTLALVPLNQIVLVRGSRAVRRAEWTDDDAWQISNGRGQTLPALLARRTAILGRWVLLAWTTPEGPRMAALDPAVMPAHVQRSLRIRLRLCAGRPGRPGWY